MDGGTVVRYTDADPGASNGSTASLYYDTDQVGFDGKAVSQSQNVPEAAGSGALFFDTQGLANGTYYPYVVVKNGNATSQRYSQAKVVVNHTDTSTPAQPATVTATTTGTGSGATTYASWTSGGGNVLAWVVAVTRTDGTTVTTYLPPETTSLALGNSPAVSTISVAAFGNGGPGLARAASPVLYTAPDRQARGVGRSGGHPVVKGRSNGAICGREASEAGRVPLSARLLTAQGADANPFGCVVRQSEPAPRARMGG